MNRQRFEPKLIKVDSLMSNLWQPDQISQYTLPKTNEETILMLQLLIQSMKWMGSYENWILTTYGETYRHESLQNMSSHGVFDIRLDKKMV